MFTMMMAVGWQENMLDVMKSTGINTEPRFHSPFDSGVLLSLFILVWMIVGFFFIQNLFVAVVIAGYNRESEKSGSSLSMTKEQLRQTETELLKFKTKPIYRH